MLTATIITQSVRKGSDMKVSELRYIPINVQKKLEIADVIELEDLIQLHTSPRRCLEVSEQTNISLDILHEIISSAIFYQVPGIGSYHSSLLVKAGIDSVYKLANVEVDVLLNAMNNLKSFMGVTAIVPTHLMLTHWKKRAQAVFHD